MSAAPAPPPVELERGLPLAAAWALLGVAVRGLCRVRRMVVLGLLYSLPVAMAVLFRALAVPRMEAGDDIPRQFQELEFGLVYVLIPNVLAPLSALLFGTGVVQDEQEDQTLTYLLVRPLPRWAIYTTKLFAAFIVSGTLLAAFTALTLVALWIGSGQLGETDVPQRLVRLLPVLLLTLATYLSLFGCLSLIVKRALVVGTIYLILFEFVFANIPFVLRQFTVMYYFQCLVVNLLRVDKQEWNIDVPTDTETCLSVLLSTILVAVFAAAYLFSTRELRVKTPEGN